MADLASLPDVLTADELAPLVRVTPQHVRKLARTQGHVMGVQPIVGVGRKVLFSKALVVAVLEGRAS